MTDYSKVPYFVRPLSEQARRSIRAWASTMPTTEA